MLRTDHRIGSGCFPLHVNVVELDYVYLSIPTNNDLKKIKSPLDKSERDKTNS